MTKHEVADSILAILVKSPDQAFDFKDINREIGCEYIEFLSGKAMIIERYSEWIGEVDYEIDSIYERTLKLKTGFTREVNNLLDAGGFTALIKNEEEGKRIALERKEADEEAARKLNKLTLDLTDRQIKDWDASILRSWWSLGISIAALLAAIIAAIAAFK